MRKKWIAGILFVVVLFVAVYAGGCAKQEDYSYVPNPDFINLNVSFGGGTGVANRAFSFMTPENAFPDPCEVQLDPAPLDAETPSFTASDNLSFPATSSAYPWALAKRTVYGAYAEGLLPATKYFYRAGCPTVDQWSAWGSFVTDDGDDKFTFLHITDAQADTDEEFENFSLTLHKAFETAPGAEFVLSSGDQIEGDYVPIYWDQYFSSIDDIVKTKTFSVARGNHEVFDELLKAHYYLPDIKEEDYYYYAYEYGNCLFMVMDIFAKDSQTQLEFMRSVMSASTKKWKIISAHYSAYSIGTHADDLVILKWKDFITPFAAQNSVDLVLSGHDHLYARTYPLTASGEIAVSGQTQTSNYEGTTKTTYTNPNGTIYIMNRCAGSKFYGKTNTLNDHLLAKNDPGKIMIPVFSSVVIDGNKLTYTSYEHERDAGTVRVFDCIELIKN